MVMDKQSVLSEKEQMTSKNMAKLEERVFETLKTKYDQSEQLIEMYNELS